jgi:hypothetical protein
VAGVFAAHRIAGAMTAKLPSVCSLIESAHDLRQRASVSARDLKPQVVFGDQMKLYTSAPQARKRNVP